MTAPSSSPLGRLVDLAVFAPIGLVCRLRDEVPQLADAGRERIENRLRVARIIGELAVKQGRREVVRRLDEVAAQRQLASEPMDAAEALVELLIEESVAEPPVVESVVVEEPDTELLVAEGPEAGAVMATKRAAVAADARTLPISDYDSLAASQVVARLEALGPDELEAIGNYEAAKRGRRTILGKVQQLQAR